MATFGSVCSGIEAASVAWHTLGWKASWLSEIEAFPSAVLQQRWSGVPNVGDMLHIVDYLRWGVIAAPDVLVGGTPCQSFSVSGLRKGLADARGQLTYTFVDIANEIDRQRDEPCVVLWENVPGVLSDKTNAFGCFLGYLCGETQPLLPSGGRWAHAGCVSGPQRRVAWRILDAQYFGLAQRRRRVFVVASARKNFDPSKVLFEFDGVRRDNPPSREKGKGFTAATAPSTFACGGIGQYSSSPYSSSPILSSGSDLGHGCEALILATVAIPINMQCATKPAEHGPHGVGVGVGVGVDGEPANTLNANDRHAVAPPLSADADKGDQDTLIAFSCKDYGNDVGETAPTLRSMNNATGNPNGGGQVAICCPVAGSQTVGANQTTGFVGDCVAQPAVAWSLMPQNSGKDFKARQVEVLQPLMAGAGSYGNQGGDVIQTAMQVRRLTPRECERLQGFPDDYTLIQVRGKPAADGPRYKALGNSMAVPVMRWIGKRINDAL